MSICNLITLRMEDTLVEILEVGVEEEMLQHLLAKWRNFIIKGHFPHLHIHCFSHGDTDQEDKEISYVKKIWRFGSSKVKFGRWA